MPYRIGVRGCQHLGYSTQGMRLNPETAWNQRIVDGHHAHRETMVDMIATGVDGIIDGGDLYHWNKPVARDIEVANRVDDLRVDAGIWELINSGNHDAGGALDTSAAGVMHRPHVGAHAVYPDPTRAAGEGFGPYPGLYEVHMPTEGLAIHVVSHYGLSRNLADQGINIDPTPIEGCINILTSHGMLQVDDEWLHSLNEHGEERPVPTEWLERNWDASVFSHIHEQYRVDFGPQDATRGQVWWTGSAVRRGFADDACARGWLEVVVNDDGRVDVIPHAIWQRPQHDLQVIEAADLSVADIDDIITLNLTSVAMHDDDSLTRTGHGGAIVRQRVRGTTAAQRQGLNALASRYARLTADATWWQLAHDRSATNTTILGDGTARAVTNRVTDFTGALQARADRLFEGIKTPTPLRPEVLASAIAYTDNLATAPESAERDDTHTAALSA